MQIAVLGIDLGKNSCSVAGLDSAGLVVTRRRMRPTSIAAFTGHCHLRSGNRGVVWRAPSRSSAGSPGPPGPADATRVSFGRM